MEKISEMIERLCPERIEKVPLWELTAWDKKFNAVDKAMQKKIIKYSYLLAKELDDLVDDSGDIRILYTTEDVAYTTEEKAEGKISEGEIVAIPWGGNPTVKYYNGRFVTGDNRIATSLDTSRLENKYLYYWMLGQIDVISSFYRGAGIKHPSMYSVLTMEIPLPPLSIQQEIVRILDTFTSMITNLETELASRQKQYEHYRNKLLTFDENDESVEWKTLKAISENCDKQRKPITSSKRVAGEYPYYGASGIVDYVKGYIFEGDYLLISEDGANLVVRSTPIAFSISGKNWVNNHAHVIKFEHRETRRLVEIYLNSIDLSPWITGGAQPKLNQEKLNTIPLPIPSFEMQQEIVSILDTFESLITNIKQELDARKKQYEYYREQLLTFRPSPALP